MLHEIDLFDITGQESGIVVYDNSVIVCNWAGKKGLPRMFVGADPVFLPFECDAAANVENLGYKEDVRDALPGPLKLIVDENEAHIEGVEILSDPFADILALWGYEVTFADETTNTVIRDADGNHMPTGGNVYQVGEATVIAPEGWN